MTALTPANENPWYVLMTLYGEQDGEGVNRALHQQNRAAWNAWSCQSMSEEERASAAISSRVSQEEVSSWPKLKLEVERRHRCEWQRRNGEDLAYPGIPDVSKGANLIGVEFPLRLSMEKTVFSGPAMFMSASFSAETEFDDATFIKLAGFYETKFSASAVFSDVTFGEGAWFTNVSFGGSAVFEGAKFSGGATFISTKFAGLAMFNHSTINGQTQFGKATFDKWASFESAMFGGEAFFGQAKFNQAARFNSATFCGYTYFSEVMFGEVGEDHVVAFADCHFQKPTSFRNAVFKTRYPDFAGAMLHDKTAFADHPDSWPNGVQNALSAKACCAVIRHNLGKQGLPEAEHFFYRREMGFAGRSGPLLQRPPYWAFGWFSDYGHSILTPFLWLFLLIALGAHVLTLGLWGGPLEISYWQGFELSFANVFNFLGFQRAYFPEKFTQSLPNGLRLLSAIQTVFGVLLLFFLGLGLRTRFRLR